MRDVEEWVGANDNTAIPPRVKERIARKAGDCCQNCKRPIGGRLRPEFDHVTPLILGGKHAESNLQLLCSECHSAKSKLDVKLKAKLARVRRRHLGIRPKSRFACSRDGKFKRKVSGEIVLR